MTILSKTTALVSSLLAMNSTMSTPKEYIKLEIIEEKAVTPDIVIRPGEYPNKPGKRIYLSEKQIYSFNIPKDIPIHKDKEGYYIHEFDINLKLSKAIGKELKKLGINTNLQVAKDKSQDLNQAGRTAMATGAKMYLSVHHDYYKADTEGYTFITNQGDDTDTLIAQELSNSIKGGLVKQKPNRTQGGYIGEMNQTGDMINVLGEFGFFSNLEELQKIISDEQVQYVAQQIAKELAIILK